MFTGIVEEVGTVEAVEPGPSGARITIHCRRVLADATLGASVAVNGTCITATEIGENHFSADLSPETLARTNLGALAAGAAVNLERPLRFNGRLDGHFVLGHVDATATVAQIEDVGDGNWLLTITVPAEFSRYIVPKASVAVNGISLTVANIDGNSVGFAIIPHTWANTNLSHLRSEHRVNLEVDILAKHLEKLIAR